MHEAVDDQFNDGRELATIDIRFGDDGDTVSKDIVIVDGQIPLETDQIIQEMVDELLGNDF